jgi:hypothetical protein
MAYGPDVVVSSIASGPLQPGMHIKRIKTCAKIGAIKTCAKIGTSKEKVLLASRGARIGGAHETTSALHCKANLFAQGQPVALDAACISSTFRVGNRKDTTHASCGTPAHATLPKPPHSPRPDPDRPTARPAPEQRRPMSPAAVARRARLPKTALWRVSCAGEGRAAAREPGPAVSSGRAHTPPGSAAQVRPRRCLPPSRRRLRAGTLADSERGWRASRPRRRSRRRTCSPRREPAGPVRPPCCPRCIPG